MSAEQPPPAIAAGDRVILFDGVCKLCHAWVRFVIRHDRERRFRLAPVQSLAGQRILAYFDMPTTRFDTVLYIEQGRAYQKSEAVLRVFGQLGWPWKLLGAARLCPRALRDWCYERIACRRYRIFGRYEQYTLPTADHPRRFLDARENGDG